MPSAAPVDLLGGMGMLSPTPAAPAPAPVAVPTPTPPAAPVDPFASAGLAGPMQNMSMSSAPMVNGVQVVPLRIDTPAFGGKWTVS